MQIKVAYDPVGSIFTIEQDMSLGYIFGTPTVSFLYLTEAELQKLLLSYLKQRASYRRMARFVDPSIA